MDISNVLLFICMHHFSQITPSHLNKFISFKGPRSENAPMTTASLRKCVTRKELFRVPIQSLHDIFTYIWLIFYGFHVGKYLIHESMGYIWDYTI